VWGFVFFDATDGVGSLIEYIHRRAPMEIVPTTKTT
jgi:hypothetical protein